MTYKRLLRVLSILAVFGFGLFWWLTIPTKYPDSVLFGLKGSATKGAQVFAASGCASCHSAKNAEGEEKLTLVGGRAFPSDFGTFYAPNISSSLEHGLGAWSFIEFANALSHGTSPKGKHYYPAFPYTTYQHMTVTDLADLYAYMQTLPAVETPSKQHEVGFPFNLRRGLGLWKLVFSPRSFHMQGVLTPQESRGRYLVEAMGHCTECHTPRNFVGGLQLSKWMAGGPNPDGPGSIPNITPHADGILTWSTLDIVTYLNSGFTPEFDTAGGQMVEVIENIKKLPPEDHQAIAAYLKKLAPLPSAPKL